jgi:DNA-directed RNA polymerase specialized sigma24 family protein
MADFRALLERLRTGDGAAAAEIVRTYEPALMRVIRVKMADPRLKKLHGESDIFQSVMGSFFVRVALGQYDLREPEDLARLLAVMARNKVAEKARRRDVARGGEDLDGEGAAAVAAPDASPSRVVELRQLAEIARARLPADLIELVALRDDGLEWKDIAARIGGTADAHRKRLARAASAIALELGFDDHEG